MKELFHEDGMLNVFLEIRLEMHQLGRGKAPWPVRKRNGSPVRKRQGSSYRKGQGSTNK